MELDRLQSKPKFKKIGGWLLGFCLILIVITPMATIINLVSAYEENALRLIEILVNAGLAVFSVYAGILLWQIRPEAVKVTKIFLIVNWALRSMFAYWDIIRLITNKVASTSPQWLDASLSAIGPMIFLAIWMAYLDRSERVKETYRLDQKDVKNI
ncbi:DUF2569 domain-containing protein [Patescibacteria group bacterium]|nr:DUF2569 domain-containing protein [Patescibacteria group bacterium]MBU4017357.1 DUF2569 domain-containing protein [Patescibacteria group bacterium]MBU4099121.1 DUF2569 domain-containing protein [Patescibacteria group bacterium]